MMPMLDRADPDQFASGHRDRTTTPHDRSGMPSVAVVVLNWNGCDDTIECIESVYEVDYPNFTVLVVDNGSTDGSVDALRTRFPELEVTETGCNLGFAAGNNVGIQIALERSADYILLLNNDTVVHPGVLRELVRAAEQCPEGGIFGAKIYYHAQPDRIWYGGASWDAQSMIFRHIQNDAEMLPDARGVVPTDYVCGCALLAKSTTLRRIGLLDPTYFLTYEETDLCYRALKAAIGCYYVPGAKLWHKISVSFGGAQSPLFQYFMTRNRLLWGERHLKFRELIQLYRNTWWELNNRLHPRLHGGQGPSGLKAQVHRFMTGWGEPATRAVFWGVLHYLFRRFGDAPPRVRALAMPRNR